MRMRGCREVSFNNSRDIPIWAGTVAAVLLGSQLGSRLMAGRMKPRAVKLVFGWVLLGVAALILVKDVILA